MARAHIDCATADGCGTAVHRPEIGLQDKLEFVVCILSVSTPGLRL